MNHAGEEVSPLKNIAFFEELMNVDKVGRRQPEECSLQFHTVIERKIVAVHHDRRASVLIKLGETAYVIDVGVGTDDSLNLQFVAAEKAKDAFHFVTGIDNDGFVSARVADNRAIALKQPDRKLEINHLRVSSVRERVRWMNVVHGKSIPSRVWGIFSVVSSEFLRFKWKVRSVTNERSPDSAERQIH